MNPAAFEPYYVYILRCSDGTFYTGTAKDAAKRVSVHNSGKGAKYTRSRLPVQTVYTERCASKGDALRTEYAVKRLSRREKEKRITRRERLRSGLSCFFAGDIPEGSDRNAWTVRALLDSKEIGRTGLYEQAEHSEEGGGLILAGPEVSADWENTGLEMDLFCFLCEKAKSLGIREIRIPSPEETGPKQAFAARFGIREPEGDGYIHIWLTDPEKNS